ncbi:LysR substrate-binding domain-containing protein [Streptomyces sp.]|uniref:LysR substrate-binding domain-containing protein n=1 Tax=Streptomyces sp. TaxID=1931 RepID=UPI002F3EB3CB
MQHATAAAPRSVGIIRLGYHGSPVLPRAVLRRAGFPVHLVRLVEHEVADPFQKLRAGGLDVMVVKFGLGQAEPDLRRSRPVGHDPRAVLVAADHPLAARKSVSVEEVADYGVFDCPGVMPPAVWDEAVPRTTPSGRSLRRTHPLVDVADMITAVAAGEAVHLSLASLADVLPPGVTAVPVHDLPSAPVALAWCTARPLPDDVARLVRAAEAAAGVFGDAAAPADAVAW